MSPILSILKRSLHILKKTWLVQFLMNCSQPLLYMTAMGIGVGAYISDMNGLSYFKFVSAGIVASAALWEAAFSCTYDVFTRIHYRKVYQAILTTPATISDLVWGEILTAVVKSTLYSFAVFGVIYCMGVVDSWLAILFPIPVILLALVIALISMIVTSLTPTIFLFNYYNNLFIAPAYAFSGVFFPMDTLPNWAQILVWLNPVYHGVTLCRGLLIGQIPPLWWAHLAVLIGLALCLAYWPTRLFYRRLIQ